MNGLWSTTSAIVILLILASFNLSFGMHYSPILDQCSPSGYLNGEAGNCNTEHDSECCKAGEQYPQYYCSPPITDETSATMTINSFAQGGDGGGPSECDSNYHSDDEMVVALSTGWYDNGSRCLKTIRINANGKSVSANVVDECDSKNGCDAEHDFQPPCRNNIVDASQAVWNALEISGDDVGEKYPQYHCSPPITDETSATMTINSFAKGEDGGGPSECDGNYHGDGEMVVALSTGWYDNGSRCLNKIRINANGKSVLAKVVDECDSVYGCDVDHDFQPPCHNNIVDASPAVWDALGIYGDDVGDYHITWSDA